MASINSEHDIEFTREGSQVVIRVTTDLPYQGKAGCDLLFRCERGNEQQAELMMRYLRQRHWDAIETIRRREFMSGWKRAKAKKEGLQWFDSFTCGMRQVGTWDR